MGGEERRLNLGDIKCATLDLNEGELFPLMTETDMMETRGDN